MLPRLVLPGAHGLSPAAALLILVLVVPALSAAQCPTNTVTCEGTTQGVVDFYLNETSTGPTHGVSFNQSHASYNLVDGRVRAKSYVDDSADRHRCVVTAVDRFELHNVPAAVLKIRLNLSFFWLADPSGRMAWADGFARLNVDGQSVDAESIGSGMVGSIELDIAVTEGVPFLVTYEVIADARGYYPWCELVGTLEFVDLPAGAEITSCNGYGDPSVTVKERSWSHIKALYR